MSGSRAWRICYDALGRRIKETRGGKYDELYYSDKWQVIEERKNGSSTRATSSLWSPVYVDAMIFATATPTAPPATVWRNACMSFKTPTGTLPAS